jgi:hypothetical protein
MEIEITDDFMRPRDGNKIIATARQRADGRWEVSHWPRLFDRNQAITTLTITELLRTGRDDSDPLVTALSRGVAMTDRLIRITTALAVATVAAVAAVISYRHAYELVSTHGETGVTARLVPFTVDGLILAASMLILDANRRHRPCHTSRAGASAPASRPPSAPTWRTASATAPSALWSAPGPPWRWPAPSNSS